MHSILAHPSFTTIAAASKSCDAGAFPAVRAAERAVRRFPVQLGNRSTFMEAAEEAFGELPDCDLRARLPHALQEAKRLLPLLIPRRFRTRSLTFLSNNQLATALERQHRQSLHGFTEQT